MSVYSFVRHLNKTFPLVKLASTVDPASCMLPVDSFRAFKPSSILSSQLYADSNVSMHLLNSVWQAMARFAFIVSVSYALARPLYRDCIQSSSPSSFTNNLATSSTHRWLSVREPRSVFPGLGIVRWDCPGESTSARTKTSNMKDRIWKKFDFR